MNTVVGRLGGAITCAVAALAAAPAAEAQSIRFAEMEVRLGNPSSQSLLYETLRSSLLSPPEGPADTLKATVGYQWHSGLRFDFALSLRAMGSPDEALPSDNGNLAPNLGGASLAGPVHGYAGLSGRYVLTPHQRYQPYLGIAAGQAFALRGSGLPSAYLAVSEHWVAALQAGVQYAAVGSVTFFIDYRLFVNPRIRAVGLADGIGIQTGVTYRF